MKRKIGIILFIIAVIFIFPRVSLAFGINTNTSGSFGSGGGLILLAPTATLSVSPTSVTYGAKATVTWGSTNAESCTSTGPWSNLAKKSGSTQTNAILKNSTLTFQCTNSRGKKSLLKTVSITMKSPTATLTASPPSIASGTKSLLSWSSTGATSCTATGPWSNQGTLSGNGLTKALTSNSTFTFQCAGPGGTTPVQSVTIGVGQPAVASFNPTYSNIYIYMAGACNASGYQSGNNAYASCSVPGNPLKRIGSGGGLAGSLRANITNNGVTLSNVSVDCVWYYTGTEPQCTGSKVVSVGGAQFNMWVNGIGELLGDGGGAGISGSISPVLSNGVCSATHYTCTKGTSVGNTNGSLKYSWSCTGAGGGTTAYCSETKPLVVPTATLTASSPIAYGASSTLTWTSANATSCTAVSGPWSNSNPPNGGALNGSGSTNALYSNTTFKLQCTGTGGKTLIQSATVVVGPAPKLAITASPSTVNVGTHANINWSSTGESSCTVARRTSGGYLQSTWASGLSGAHSATAKSAMTITFTLSCTDSVGKTTSAATTLTVVNHPPVISFNSSNKTITLGQSATYSASATDQDGNMNYLALNWKNPNGTYNWNSGTNPQATATPGPYFHYVPAKGSGLYTVTITPKVLGTYKVYAVAQDSAGWVYSSSYTLTVVPQVANATCGTITAPATVVAGSTFNASVSVTNTGTKTWTSALNYKLGGAGSNSSLWGPARILLPSTVSPGGSVTFSDTFKAPTTLGNQPFAWQMLQENVAWFGGVCSKTINVVTPPQKSCALPWGGTIPSGSSVTAYRKITNPTAYIQSRYCSYVKQTRTCTNGTLSGSYTLKVANTLLKCGNPPPLLPPTCTLSATPASIQKGGSSTLTYTTKGTSFYKKASFSVNNGVGILSPVAGGSKSVSPAVTTTYTGTVIGSVGTATCSTKVTVIPKPVANATCGTITAPATVVAGSTFNASVSVTNTGTKTWTSAQNYKLGSQLPQDNLTWGSSRVLLPSTVSPGGSIIFSNTFKAPTAPGNHTFAWKMLQEGVTWFGGTCSKTINITAIPVPTASISASSVSVTYGAKSTLSWTSTGATSCTAVSGPWSNSNPPNGGALNGSGSTNALYSNTTFKFQCTGPGGTTPVKSVTVNVGQAPVNGVCSATHYTCTSGTSASNVSGSASWTWACNGSNGGATASCSEIKPVKPTAYMSVSNTTIKSGQTVTISWSSTNATSCTATQGNFTTGGNTSGSVIITPSTTANYQTYCDGSGGRGYSHISNVSLTIPIPTGKLTVYPNRVGSSKPTHIKFTWTINDVKKGSDTCKLSKLPVGASMSHKTSVGGNVTLPTKFGIAAIGANTISDIINTQTQYYIECNGKEVGSPVIVNVVPTFINF